MRHFLYSVSDFIDYSCNQTNALINDVASIHRNVTSREKLAMKSSYPQVGRLLQKIVSLNPNFASAHVNIGMTQKDNPDMVLLEYQLPAASAWCDVVLLGDDANGRHQVVIIELKDWKPNTTDQAGPIEGLMYHQTSSSPSQLHSHPSDQVKGYVDYCENFHSAVVPVSPDTSSQADTWGCVFFTSKINLAPYLQVPNHQLTSAHPVFNIEQPSIDLLAQEIGKKISHGNDDFAAQFVNGRYMQNRSIVGQVANNLRTANNVRQFVLLDKQRLGYNVAIDALTQSAQSGHKEVIIIKGGPGSGKSAVAINLWIEAVNRFKDKNNLVYVTTSGSQKDNWMTLFHVNGKQKGAANICIPSNKFNPGIRGGGIVAKQVINHFYNLDGGKYQKGDTLSYDFFEDYLDFMESNGLTDPNYRQNNYFLSVVDEAHALINPSMPGYSTNKSGGWYVLAGPQAYHIINLSQISIFLLDERQSYRDNETTTIDDIRKYATKLGANITEVDISGAQFRCGGSVEYTDWVDSLFAEDFDGRHKDWSSKFKVKIFDSPSKMERDVRKYVDDGNNSCRLLSSYTVDWASAMQINADHQPIKAGTVVPYDFNLHDAKSNQMWQKYWNYATSLGDYDVFVQANRGAMKQDPLSEVGCPFVVRGFDWDHVGLLWLNDIVWRDGQWWLNFPNVKETAIGSAKKKAKDEWNKVNQKSKNNIPGLINPFDQRTPMVKKLFDVVTNAYRVLMTRGIQSISIYVEDEETREHLNEIINDSMYLLQDEEG